MKGNWAEAFLQHVPDAFSLCLHVVNLYCLRSPLYDPLPSTLLSLNVATICTLQLSEPSCEPPR